METKYSVTVNGKTKGYIYVGLNECKESIEAKAFSEVVGLLGHSVLDKIIIIPNKLVNVITKEA